jgi:hypothetical protein
VFYKFIQFLIVMLVAASLVRADSLTDMRRACLERGNFHKGIHWLEECVQEIFTATPVHIAFTSVAPGAGTAAFGVGAGKLVRFSHTDFILTGISAVSDDGSYVTGAQAAFALPALRLAGGDGYAMPSTSDRFGVYSVQRPFGEGPLDVKSSFAFGYRRIDAREQDFYGLGPGSTLSHIAGYGLILNDTYAKIDNPLNAWSSIGFSFSFLQPRVTSSINKANPSIYSAYDSSTAPGLNARNDFLRYTPHVQLRFPARRSVYATVRVEYNFYQNLGANRFSFQRLFASSSTFVPLWVPSKGTPHNRNGFLNFVCPSVRSATRCSLGDLKLVGSVAASYKGANSQVPFYFDQTLGGAEIGGSDTLRGFADYRFRASNSMLFQAEYRHKVWGPFGLLAFYDLGKVALLPSDLSLDHLRHDIGVGGFLRIGNREVIRLYAGFGTGEPTRLHSKIPVSF